MHIFHQLCNQLRIVATSVEDVSEKGGVKFAPVHAVAYGQSWYGMFRYKFATGCFGATEADYSHSLRQLRNVSLRDVLHDARNANLDRSATLERICYQHCPSADDGSTTLAHLFQKLLSERSAAARAELRSSANRRWQEFATGNSQPAQQNDDNAIEDNTEEEQTHNAAANDAHCQDGSLKSISNGDGHTECLQPHMDHTHYAQQPEQIYDANKSKAHHVDPTSAKTDAQGQTVHAWNPIGHGESAVTFQRNPECKAQQHADGVASASPESQSWLVNATHDLLSAANFLLMEYAPATVLSEAELRVKDYRHCMEVVRNTKHFIKRFINPEDEMLQLAQHAAPQSKNARPALLKEEAFLLWCQPLLRFDSSRAPEDAQETDPPPVPLYLSTSITLSGVFAVLKERLRLMYPCLSDAYVCLLLFQSTCIHYLHPR